MENLDEKAITEEVETLLVQLKQHQWETNRRVEDALANLGRRAVPRLLRALNDEDGYVRSAAARALGKIGDPAAVDSLIAGMKYRDERKYEDNEDVEARMNAAVALGEIGDLRAVDELLNVASDKDSLLACYAIDALGLLRDSRAIPTLIAALQHQDLDKPKAARAALISIGQPAVLPLLESLKASDGHWRHHALKALGAIGDRRAMAVVSALLNDPDDGVRLSAGAALKQMQNRK